MASRDYFQPRNRAITAGKISLLLLFVLLICGCLQAGPEELPPQAAAPGAAVTGFPAAPAGTAENTSSTHSAIVITSPKLTRLYTEQDFPPEVTAAISDFTGGRTTNTLNGFMRWESVRARTSQPDKSHILDQIRAIDYALFNTTLKEQVRVYAGVSREQAKRIRNDSVFSENGYTIASCDPSVAYHQLANSGRDSEGYLTLCVIDFRKGDHLLFVNATEKEFLLPHGGIWDVAGEETYEQLEYSADSIPRYGNTIPTKVRLISTKEHP